MPELPEVETMRRGLVPLVGSTVHAVEKTKCRLKSIGFFPAWPTLRRRLLGQKIDEVARAGKRVTIRLSSGDHLIFEPRMTGLVLLTDPPDRAHLRLRIGLRHGEHRELWFWDRRGLGSVSLLTSEQFAERLGPPALGPDALGISPRILREQLAGSSRPLKVALLGQRWIAGIGNLYASEILHLARLSPFRSCNTLRQNDWSRLHAALGEVLEAAIRYEGSTLADGTYRNALNQNGSYQNHHRVYQKAGKSCPTCGRRKIQRAMQAQRSTFYCPACQPVPRALREKIKVSM